MAPQPRWQKSDICRWAWTTGASGVHTGPPTESSVRERTGGWVKDISVLSRRKPACCLGLCYVFFCNLILILILILLLLTPCCC